ncbi:hypothetical protein GCM10022198_00270 [Klugiella xanthotipulae]|uniref:Phage Mu protein F like protein n=1 Tax=Klugiella xanthotipulae TaxID=244735 RepID=A0A543I5G0_9MICO|nr:hypothetical protein [Klugiella xanthotipulae]TQM65832.1 hypothetical protein FB466_0646 [Klugiella xanthotipulae]
MTSKELAYQAMVAATRERVLAQAAATWTGLGSYRDFDARRFVAQVVPLVQAGQLHVATLTAAHIAGAATATPIDRDAILDGRGTATSEVYRRPFVTAYTALSEGVPLDEALRRGAARLMGLASTDMQMSRVRQAQRSMVDRGIDQYHRVLTGRENCALCVIASTQRYWVANLMPIHPGCDCSPQKLTGNNPLRQVINPDLLNLTHKAIDQQLGLSDRGARDLGLGKESSAGNPLSDYTDLITTQIHGEIGPVLTWRSHQFTTPADIPDLT